MGKRLLIIALAIPVLAGCGTKTAPITTHTPAATVLSHAELVVRLNAICVQFNTGPARRAQQQLARIDSEQYAALAAIFDQAADDSDPSIRATESLHPNHRDADALGRYVQSLRRAQSLEHRLADAYRARNIDRVQELAQVIQDTNAQRIAAAVDLDADRCGQT